VIFSRGRGAGRHAKVEDARGASRQAGFDDGRDDDFGYDEEPATADFSTRDVGPYDVNDGVPDVPHLDLGALRIPATDGVEVRMQADNEGTIQQVVLVHNDSALQLGVFAAPRSDGIWAEVRAEIRKQLFNDGVAAEEVDGEYGTQLRARVRTPDGLTDIRFIGIDGPRWMVRAVFQGPAAVDPSVAQPLVDCLHGLVVDRGHEAMPVREPLPLRLPREVADQAQAAAAAGETANGTAPAPRPAGAPAAAAGTRPASAPTDQLGGGFAVGSGGESGAESTAGTAPRRKPSPRPRRR
jgi:hypothetical protein